MSNYSKYLQAFFLPLQLPVAEALWSIEKGSPGKIRHTVAGKSGLKHTQNRSLGCYGFHVQTTESYAREGLVVNLFFALQNFKDQVWTIKYMGKWDT